MSLIQRCRRLPDPTPAKFDFIVITDTVIDTVISGIGEDLETNGGFSSSDLVQFTYHATVVDDDGMPEGNITVTPVWL